MPYEQPWYTQMQRQLARTGFLITPCDATSGWLKGFGVTHRCSHSLEHHGEHDYAFAPGAIEAGALSLDEQAAEYVAMFEERARLTDDELRRQPITSQRYVSDSSPSYRNAMQGAGRGSMLR